MKINNLFYIHFQRNGSLDRTAILNNKSAFYQPFIFSVGQEKHFYNFYTFDQNIFLKLAKLPKFFLGLYVFKQKFFSRYKWSNLEKTKKTILIKFLIPFQKKYCLYLGMGIFSHNSKKCLMFLKRKCSPHISRRDLSTLKLKAFLMLLQKSSPHISE